MSEAFLPENASDQSVDAIIGMPLPKRFVFTYVGENIQINQSKSEVLRRIKGASIGTLESVLSSFDENLIDFGSFSNTKLQTFSFVEDRPFGLAVHVSAQEGTISINQNWQTWEEFPQGIDFNKELTFDNLPADQMIISVADDFIQRQG